MEEELKQLKTVLRSLVVSSASEIDVRNLLRDYRNMMGTYMPLQKFGYKDAVTFLKERCSDCFLFTGNAFNPTLTLIVPDTLKHIDKFVQKQKSSATTKHKVKRRSVSQAILESQSTNLIVQSFVQKKLENEPDNIINLDEESPDKDAPDGYCSTSNSLLNGHKKENVKEESPPKEINEGDTFNKGPSTALQKFLRRRTPLYDSTDSNKFNKEKEPLKDDNDSGRQTMSSHSSLKSSKFEHLKREIQSVISEHPEGVLCTDLMRLYRERYNKELEFSRWGLTSIVSVVCELGEGVALSRVAHGGDWLVRDAAAPPRAPARPRPAPARAHPPPLDVDVDDALPGVEYDPDVYPADCMQFLESLPPAPLEGVRAGSLLEVMVGEVYSPSHLWLMRLGERHHVALDELMDEMTEYYERGEGRARELARGAVRPGQYCAARYERDWHRALLVRLMDADAVKVRLVDYGTVEQTSWRELKPLRRTWAALPTQAMRARLAGVAPACAGAWPRAACRHLLARVQQRQLVAHVAALGARDSVLEVFLVDTAGERDLCLADDLVRSGHAQARAVTADHETSERHLYPRFDALEAGATPNFGDIERYLRDGIALEYVEEYRRHVPVHLPSPERSPEPSPEPSPLPRAEAECQTSPACEEPPEEVRLSVRECELYRELCATSPGAAQWFMMGALSRALHSSLDVHAPPFVPAATPRPSFPFGPPPMPPPFAPAGPLVFVPPGAHMFAPPGPFPPPGPPGPYSPHMSLHLPPGFDMM